MKIILFTDSLGAGGAQRQLVGLAKLLKYKNYNVKVCTYHNIDFYKNLLVENGIVNDVIYSKKYILRIFAVTKYLKKENPDWVIAYLESPSLIACLAKLLGGKFKLMVSERNTTQHVGKNEKIRFLLYRIADKIVPNSYSQENFLKNNYPNLSNKIITITNFVDLDKFSYFPKERNNIIPLIVVAASIWSPKNTLGLIEAAKILSEKKYSFKIEWYGIVKGHEQYLDKCNELINIYKLHAYIELLPKTNEIHEKYKSCDYFCLPSFYEGTPNVICEAISTGRPVICSNVCDNSIYVKENYNGFLFDPTNPEDIANKLEQALLLSTKDYYTMCRNSRTLAEKLLSESNFVNKYIELLDNIK